MIVLHAPEQSSADTTIEAFKRLALSVGMFIHIYSKKKQILIIPIIGFLVYSGIAVVISLVLVFYCGPRWGKKNMLVYIIVCSLIGSISVVFTQGLGSAIVHSISKENQFTNWFIYVVMGIVAVTLIVEIVYLNKALNLFNTALVTPTYYVIFTTMTIVSSIVLYRGFDASPVDIVTCVIGFLSICSGVALLHNSKSQPDPEIALKDDDEKILLDDQQQPVPRQRSMFQMFENKSQINFNSEASLHGSQNPGAADLFPTPFSGISRYANTTRRSQSIITKHRLQSLTDTASSTEKVKSRPHSNTISIGNTGIGEEGYNRELRWRDQPTHDISNVDMSNAPTGQYYHPYNQSLVSSEKFQSNDTDTSSEKQASFSVFKQKYSTSTSTPTTAQHRAQNELDPLSSFRMQIHSGESEDRKGLVENWDNRSN